MAYSYQSDHLKDPHLYDLSKKMTRILRHKGTPCMTSDGWVNISALVEHIRCTRGEIETIATTSSKGGRPRYEYWKEYGDIVFIRAAWGRSYCTQQIFRTERVCKDDYALQNHPVNVRSHRERLVENERLDA